MPLIKGSSKKIVSQNISEFHGGKTYANTAAKFGTEKANKQAIAVALSTARRYGKKYAGGGDVEDDPIDPFSGMPITPSPQAQTKFEKIAGAIGSGLKQWVEAPGRAMEQVEPQIPGKITEADVFQDDLRRKQMREWGAGTALGMVGMGRLPGAAPEGALGIHGGDLHSPQRPPLPVPQAKYGTPEWEDQLFGHLNNAMAGKNAAPELNASLDQLYHSITGKEIPKDSPIAPAPKATQEMGPTAADWDAASKRYEQIPWEPEPSPRPASKDNYIGAGAFEKIGPQKGSNPGGVYQDPKTGEQWYVKVPKSRDHADNEILAARLYELAGVPVPEIRPTMIEGQPAIASKIVDGPQLGKMGYGLNVKNSIAKDMPIDAWLANWDAIGTGKDNIIMANGAGSTHTPYRIDMGGSLRYRAQGAPKGDKFGSEVPELKTFLDPKINKDAADVFGGMDKGITFDAVKRLEQIEPSQISEIVGKWGPRDEAEKVRLFNTLIERKQAVIDDFYQGQTNLPKAAPPTPSMSLLDPKGYANDLANYAKFNPEEALKAKNGLPPDGKKAVNKSLWAMTKTADPEMKEVINNLYSSKVKAQAKAAGMSDKDYLASLKQKKEAYKSSQEKSDAEWAKEQAEYEGNQSAKEIHEEKINTGDYASESDKQINPEFKSEPQTEARFKEVARPIKNWKDWSPPEYEPELKATGPNHAPIPRPKGPFNFPNAMHPDALGEWGYNTKVPLYKGGYDTWHGDLMDPLNKSYEKAWFAAHHPDVAKAYGKVNTYFAKPDKVIELNWPEFTGYYQYSGHSMEKAIDLARKEGADLLVLHNMVDLAGHRWSGEPHTQFAILNTKGVRSIDAKFDPSQLHLRHSHAGLVGGGLLGYGLLGQKDQGNGMKKGGRTPMAAGGFNSAKWIPRPPNLMGGIRPVGGGMPRAIAPKASPGLIHSTIPGRTDKIPRSVPGGSYIIPASVVSGMGQGNTLAGADALNKLFAQGPYGDRMQKFGTPKPNFGHPMHMAAPQMRMPKPAKAGGVEEGSDHVPIIVAGGEYQVPPEVVRRLGNGNMKQGHKILDELVMHIRRQTIKDMRNEKKPKGSGG